MTTLADVTLTTVNPSWLPSSVYVQGISKIKVDVSRSIKEPTIDYYIGSPVTQGAGGAFGYSITFDVPKNEETTHEIWVSDLSDAMDDGVKIIIETLPYEPPKIELRTERRGSYVRAYVTGSVDSLNGYNSKRLTIRYREVSSCQWEAVSPTVGWSFSDVYHDFYCNENYSYEFEAILTDNVQTVTTSGSDGTVCISELAGGKGVRFFKEAESEGFWIKDVNYDLDDYKKFPSTPKSLKDVLTGHDSSIDALNDQMNGVSSGDPQDPNNKPGAYYMAKSSYEELYGQGKFGSGNGLVNRVEALEDRPSGGGGSSVDPGESYSLSSGGNFSLSGGGGYYKDTGLVFVRGEAKVTAKNGCAAFGEWYAGYTNLLKKPPYIVALSAYCKDGIIVNAYMNASGYIYIKPNKLLTQNTVVYITGIYRL